MSTAQRCSLLRLTNRFSRLSSGTQSSNRSPYTRRKTGIRYMNFMDRSPNRLEQPRAVAFSRDGKILAASELNRHVLVYDLDANRIMREIDAFPDRTPAASAIAFSPDGGMIALGSSGESGVNRRPDGRIEFVPPNNPPLRVASRSTTGSSLRPTAARLQLPAASRGALMGASSRLSPATGCCTFGIPSKHTIRNELLISAWDKGLCPLRYRLTV